MSGNPAETRTIHNDGEKNPGALLHTLGIGGVLAEHNIFLAPMAGVTGQPFRLLCKEQGCGMVTTEMVSAKGIAYRNANTHALLVIDPKERPCAVQLFGSDPDILAESAAAVAPFADIIDINMGCPAPKIVQNGEGSALMRDPALVGRIVRKVCDAVRVPVTVKIRKGFSAAQANAVEIAQIAEQAGAAAIAVHGRTRDQYYSGQADWGAIAAVKAAVKIPVLGNGDVTGGPSAKAMLEQTGCDGILVARGAMGNPWVFHEINHYLTTGRIPPPPPADEKMRTALRHLRMLMDLKGEYLGLLEMRSHMSWYIKGLPHAALWRSAVHRAGSYADYETIVTGVAEGRAPDMKNPAD